MLSLSIFKFQNIAEFSSLPSSCSGQLEVAELTFWKVERCLTVTKDNEFIYSSEVLKSTDIPCPTWHPYLWNGEMDLTDGPLRYWGAHSVQVAQCVSHMLGSGGRRCWGPVWHQASRPWEDVAGTHQPQTSPGLDRADIRAQGFLCSKSLLGHINYYLIITVWLNYFNDLDVWAPAVGNLVSNQWGNVVWLCEWGVRGLWSQLRWCECDSGSWILFF